MKATVFFVLQVMHDIAVQDLFVIGDGLPSEWDVVKQAIFQAYKLLTNSSNANDSQLSDWYALAFFLYIMYSTYIPTSSRWSTFDRANRVSSRTIVGG